MKVSRKWLQNYFEQPLPDTVTLGEALTFHAFEIEESDADLMDVKVLPNRAADCLSHRGIARELSAILNIPIKSDPLREPVEIRGFVNPYLMVEVEDLEKCSRYIGALVKGVKVAPSPDWLREAIEAIGQHSINNIVDATNYVMFNIGQPLHAFDAAKLQKKGDAYSIGVRAAKEGEKITVLTDEEHVLSSSVSLITDANNDSPIAIAGIKGGKAAEISDDTIDIVIESANFDGTNVRRASQDLKLVTEASLRFQNRPSPELCGHAMREALALIVEIAGGEVAGITDAYPSPVEPNKKVKTTLDRINGLLGSQFKKEEVEDVFKRFDFKVETDKDVFLVTAPFERTDVAIPEDLAEEAGRILGYDRLTPMDMPCSTSDVGHGMSNIRQGQARFRGIEKVKDFLAERGFIEISTQSFAKDGEVYLANPLDKSKPALRASLDENMCDALERARHYAPLVLAPNQKPRLFEIGTVFSKDNEKMAVVTSEPVPDLPSVDDDAEYEPKRYDLSAFKPFSLYPFITRDIAFWIPGTDDGFTKSIIQEEAGELLVRVDQFDKFEKAGRVSLAFRLVFQSPDRTLTDEEANGIMQKISSVLTSKGYEVR